MSREVLFRGLRVDGKGWVEGSLVNAKNGVFILKPYRPDYLLIKVHAHTVGEFTGLCDKNGVKVFEGDWCTAMFRTKEGIQVIQGHIMMDEFMWCVDCTGCVGDDIFSINRPHSFEVIGNIHEK
jgi:hypothetical protein